MKPQCFESGIHNRLVNWIFFIVANILFAIYTLTLECFHLIKASTFEDCG